MHARLRAAIIACIGTTMLTLSAWAAPAGNACSERIDLLFSQPAPSMQGAVTLRSAFDTIAKASGVPLRGLWKSTVPEGGLDPDRLVKVEGNAASCGALLNAILEGVSEPGDPALWQCTGGGIEVGLRRALWRPQAMRVQIYDVKDLLLRVPAFRHAGIPQAGSTGSGASGGAGGGSGSTDADRESRQSIRVDELMKLIQDTVVPEAWPGLGGPCTMAPRDGLLVVRAPDFVHRQIAQPNAPRRAAARKSAVDATTKTP